MGSAYEVHVVFVEELGDDLGAEGETDAPVVFTPAHGVLVWIRPEQVAEEALVGHIRGAHDAADLLHRLQVRAETAVAADDLLVDDGRYGQAVEAVGERLPELNVVAALALVIKAIDPVDGGALVVTTQEEKVLWVLDLVSQ